MRRATAATRAGAVAWLVVAGSLFGWAVLATGLGCGLRLDTAVGSTRAGLPTSPVVTWLDWQPALAGAQPWRAWTAVGVHYSGLHLAANLAGTLVTAGFGLAARVPVRAAWAWFAAWPLTQFGLLIQPALLHFGGLSGVLHAGVAVVVVSLLAGGGRTQRLIALAVLAGLTFKLIGEAPWGPPLRRPPGWDIAVAPLAHATGTFAGLVCGLVAIARPRHRPRQSGACRPS